MSAQLADGSRRRGACRWLGLRGPGALGSATQRIGIGLNEADSTTTTFAGAPVVGALGTVDASGANTLERWDVVED